MTERPWSNGFEGVAELTAERTGLVFGPARRAQVEAGMRRAMEGAGVTDLERYRALLARDQRTLDDLAIELTVGETYFFREPGHWELLRRVVLPDVLRRRGPKHPLRMWSAGCSTGEEAYTLAILLEDERLAARPYILGTDISRAALKTARKATYRAWSFRATDDALVERCFRREPDPQFGRRAERFQLNSRFKQAVDFEYLNLALNAYPSLETGTWGMDCIICRNALIYFDRKTIQHVAQHLRRCLAEGGWLMLGPSDPAVSEYAELEPVVTEWGVLYRRVPSPQFRITAFELEKTAPVEPTPAPTPMEPIEPTPIEKPAPAEEEALAAVGVSEPTSGNQVPAALDVLAEASAALAAGDYQQAVELVREIPDDAAARALHVRALAALDVGTAERVCAAAVKHNALAAELHHLHSMLLVGLGRLDEAAQAARRVVYLDSSLAIGYFTLGSILRRTGDPTGARRAYRNARDLCAGLPPEEVAPLSDGEPAGWLANVAAIELGLLNSESEVAP